MNSSNIAIHVGRRMTLLSRGDRGHNGGVATHRLQIGVATVLVTLLLALPAAAGEYYPAPAFFAGSMSADSSWDEILKARGIQAQFPFVGFGNTFVPINGVCLDGDKLAIADPRSDNGVRVSADQFREQARTAMARMGDGAPARVDRFAAVAPSAQGSLSESPASPIRYPVNVYRVLQSLSTIYVFLFQKPWEIPTCTAQ
jgi:hypothetical protein